MKTMTSGGAGSTRRTIDRAAGDAARIIAGQCLAIRARRLQRSITRVYDAALRPHGLGVAQLGLLVAVALAPRAQPKALCATLDLEKSTMSRNVTLMVKNGWIATNRSGRALSLTLTPAGAAVLAAVFPAWKRAQRKAQRLLSSRTVETIRRSWRPVDR